jgi:hypothetical protein
VLHFAGSDEGKWGETVASMGKNFKLLVEQEGESDGGVAEEWTQ